MNFPGDKPHRRYNPLTGEWVLVSAHRTERPWQGQQEDQQAIDRPQHDPACYLCPGGTRASGAENPDYAKTFVFTNDYPALLPGNTDVNHTPGDNLFKWENASGTSRVICYSPRHDLSLPQLPLHNIEGIIKTWMDQTQELGQDYKWVQIFENKGAMMGASNPHPHGQIWASDFMPTEVHKEDLKQSEYFKAHSNQLLIDYVQQEMKQDSRIVWKNDSWVALVPFWAIWPFETIVLPRKPIARMIDLSETQIRELAQLLKILLTKYDHLFDTSFPYSMGWHAAPNDDNINEHWTLHAHIYPPLLRSATIKKFLVGYELIAESQRDLSAETAAQRLARLPETYSK